MATLSELIAKAKKIADHNGHTGRDCGCLACELAALAHTPPCSCSERATEALNLAVERAEYEKGGAA